MDACRGGLRAPYTKACIPVRVPAVSFCTGGCAVCLVCCPFGKKKEEEEEEELGTGICKRREGTQPRMGICSFRLYVSDRSAPSVFLSFRLSIFCLSFPSCFSVPLPARSLLPVLSALCTSVSLHPSRFPSAVSRRLPSRTPASDRSLACAFFSSSFLFGHRRIATLPNPRNYRNASFLSGALEDYPFVQRMTTTAANRSTPHLCLLVRYRPGIPSSRRPSLRSGPLTVLFFCFCLSFFLVLVFNLCCRSLSLVTRHYNTLPLVAFALPCHAAMLRMLRTGKEKRRTMQVFVILPSG